MPLADYKPWRAAQSASRFTLGVALGCGVALSAQAFTPISGPIAALSSAPTNVVILLDSSSSMVINPVDGETRLDLARAVAKELISDNRHLRFGLFGFRDTLGTGAGRDAPGGQLLVEVGSIASDSADGMERINALYAGLDSFNPGNNPADLSRWAEAPLAESYYELSRYLRGLRAFYPQTTLEAGRTQFVSPIQYRCQRNIGLVLTGGQPTYDNQFPTTLGQEPDGNNPALPGAFNIPNWDGDASGDVTSADPSVPGSTFYLNDMAQFAFDIDMRKSGLGSDLAGGNWDDPDFAVQNMRTHILGFSREEPRLRAAAGAGGGSYHYLGDRDQLRAALGAAFNARPVVAGSGGGAMADAEVLALGSTGYYRSLFDPQAWSGTLQRLLIGADGQLETELWSTDSTFTPTRRAGLFQTWRQQAGTTAAAAVGLNAATYSGLTVGQRDALDAAALNAGLSGVSAGQGLLDWARGVDVPGLRRRSVLLGDIINSAPLLVAAGQTSPGTTAAYRSRKSAALSESLVVGANDGFLRVFDAATGAHRFSFLPAAMYASLGVRAQADYGAASAHSSGVDGRIALADVQLDEVWSTLVASGFGAGGKGLVAVRLFDEAQGDAALGALWEVNASQPGLAALGHVYGKPVITTLDGRSLLITGNGYGSSDGAAALMIFDLASGALLRQLDVPARPGESSANGLSAAVLHQDANGRSSVFAGDLHGQLWKFDLSGASAEWSVAHEGAPLFRGQAHQPITQAPQVAYSARARADLVFFGSGKLLEPNDLADRSVQAFYAVKDVEALPASGSLTPARLQLQQIQAVPLSSPAGTFRQSTGNQVDWSAQYGWRLPLEADGSPLGEKVTRDLLVRDARVYFTTGYIEPGADPCQTRANGWLMVLSLDSGAMLQVATIDTSGDGRVDGSDARVAGKRLDIGLPGDLTVLGREPHEEPTEQAGCEDDVIMVQGSSDLASITTRPNCQFRRIMWRQRM